MGEGGGSSSQSGREALLHALLDSPSLEQTGSKWKGSDSQMCHRNKIRLFHLEKKMFLRSHLDCFSELITTSVLDR